MRKCYPLQWSKYAKYLFNFCPVLSRLITYIFYEEADCTIELLCKSKKRNTSATLSTPSAICLYRSQLSPKIFEQSNLNIKIVCIAFVFCGLEMKWNIAYKVIYVTNHSNKYTIKNSNISLNKVSQRIAFWAYRQNSKVISTNNHLNKEATWQPFHSSPVSKRNPNQNMTTEKRSANLSNRLRSLNEPQTSHFRKRQQLEGGCKDWISVSWRYF